MKVALAQYKFINNDIEFNINQIENALIECEDKADLLVFGECFIQGFDSLNWNYENDKYIGIELNSKEIKRICSLSIKYKTDIICGYIEKYEESLYSSCLLIAEGKIEYNYRRISKGWKDYRYSDDHYKEGNEVKEIIYRDNKIIIGLCGDLWDYKERFKSDSILIWPLYVNFDLDTWKKEELNYAKQAKDISKDVLIVNSLSDNPKSYGGTFYIKNGIIQDRLDYDKEEILLVEIKN